MKPQEAVIKETVHIAIGVAVLCVLMMIVFLILHQFTGLVALGALFGFIAAVGNFFLMAMTVQKVTMNLNPEDGDAMKLAKAKMKASYSQRLLLMAVLLVAGMKLLNANWISSMLPLFFPRITIMAMSIYKKNTTKGSVF